MLKNPLIKLLSYLYGLYYLLFQKTYFNSHHFEITFPNWYSIKIDWYKHDQYIEYKKEDLKKAKRKLSSRDFINYVFDNCRQCTFVIFTCGNQKTFIQFWLGDGGIEGDWVLEGKNDLSKYSYPMLGVLNELGIHEVKLGGKKPKHIPYYRKEINKGSFTYAIYFKNYQADSVEFVVKIFAEVFKQDLKKLRVKIG